jgi:hypothetical protein
VDQNSQSDLTVTEVARLLRLHPVSVRRMIRLGRLAGCYVLPSVGHKRPRWRIRRDALEMIRGRSRSVPVTACESRSAVPAGVGT